MSEVSRPEITYEYGEAIPEETFIFEENVSPEFRKKFLEIYATIPLNLKQFLEKNKTKIIIRQVTIEKMIELVGNSYEMCADPHDMSINYLGIDNNPSNDNQIMAHELSHLIFFNIRKYYPETANQWKELWISIRNKLNKDSHEATIQDIKNGFLSWKDLEDEDEGFAEASMFLSGQGYIQPNLNNEDIQKKLNFVANLKIPEEKIR